MKSFVISYSAHARTVKCNQFFIHQLVAQVRQVDKKTKGFSFGSRQFVVLQFVRGYKKKAYHIEGQCHLAF